MYLAKDKKHLDFSCEEEYFDQENGDFEEEAYSYTVLPFDQITTHMMEISKDVSGVIQLPTPTTRMLLHHFNWDVDKLYERYYESDDPQKLFSEAHIVYPNDASKKSLKNGDTFDCMICYCDYPAKETVNLACGHSFCRACWNSYITVKITSEGQSVMISCANYDCDIIVDEETVLAAISDRAVLRRYEQLKINSFVDCNKHLRWCPKAGCSRAVKVEFVKFKPVICQCKMVFCFLCNEAWHFPLKCDLLKKWAKKCSDESETFTWIAANTKDCPNCKSPIEKNGGCNRILCRNTNCGYEFCWLCMQSWRVHGYQPCNRYNSTEAKEKANAQAKAREALKRYLFFANRFMHHGESLKLEHQLYETVHEKVKLFQQKSASWVELQFLPKTVDILCRCRQTLMYSYAFAYYQQKNNHLHIFEDNQVDFESAVEQLSAYLERDLNFDSIEKVKTSVLDKSKYCESRRKAMLTHIEEGYDSGHWVLNEDVL